MKTLLTILLISLMALSCSSGDDDDDKRGDSYYPVDNDDDDDFNGDFDDDTDDDYGDVWIDASSGLMWQNGDSFSDMGWNDAFDYCAELDAGDGLGGYKGWRLPTISELRSFIRGCPATETGGECGVTDECLDRETCWSESCRICEPNEGPGAEGRYWPEGVEGDGWSYWSSSERMDNLDDVWVVGLNRGNVNDLGITGSYSVRCVRNP